MTKPIESKVIDQLVGLPEDLQVRVLEFAKSLSLGTTRGVPGKDLLDLAGTIPADDLVTIRKAIEEGCEQVEIDEW